MFRWGILLLCLILNAPFAEAQRADRAQRLDRLDRVQDRASARDRIANRAIADRARERTVTDRPVTDVVDEPVRDADEAIERDAVTQAEDDSARAGAIVLDPFGDRIRRGEVLALNPSDEAVAELTRRNLREVRRRSLSEDAVLYLFRSPGAANLRDLLDTVQAIDPIGLYAPNHVFEPNGEPEPTLHPADAEVSDQAGNACNIGLIDGPVHGLPVAYQAAISQVRRFETGPISESLHGTTVAHRLISTAEQLVPARPMSICAADVFLAGPEEAITAEAIAAALNWQMAQRVELINASLAGPHNVVVAWSVEQFVASGGTLVAAVGNGGPLSRNIYPAAYDSVVGVTAVDSGGRLYALASQGAHVDVAAHGVNIDASQIGVEGPLSGTSFATPIVTGWMAARGHDSDLKVHAFIDRGDAGRDSKFGLGELNISVETMAPPLSPMRP